MPSFVTVDASAMKRIVARVGAGRAVLAKPFDQGRGLQVAKIMRTGPKGVYRQFVDQTEYRGTSAIPWVRTKPFGNRPAPRKTLLGTGLYRSAWLGGAGGTEKITASSVEIGVDRGLFPQVRIHQSRNASTTIKPKARTKGGKDFKMRFFLGLTYGVWMSRARIAKGIKVPRRRVSVASETRKAAVLFLRREVGAKVRLPRLTTAAIR